LWLVVLAWPASRWVAILQIRIAAPAHPGRVGERRRYYHELFGGAAFIWGIADRQWRSSRSPFL